MNGNLVAVGAALAAMTHAIADFVSRFASVRTPGRYRVALIVASLLLFVGLDGLAAAEVVIIEKPQATYSRNSIATPGWERGQEELDASAFQNIVTSTLLGHATQALQSAGYAVHVGQPSESLQGNLLTLSISVRVTRAWKEPCVPGKKSDRCLAGVDPRTVGGIWDPNKQEFLAVNPVIADTLEIVCELKPKAGTGTTWSDRASMVPLDKTGPIPVGQQHLDELAAKVLKRIPKPKNL